MRLEAVRPLKMLFQRRRELIVDTDIGTNVDDCLALAYLLRSRRSEIRAITTVTGSPAQRATLAARLCREIARDGALPLVEIGADHPLRGEQLQRDAPLASPEQYGQFGSEAVQLLCECAGRMPGRFTLLCLGPLTNIALMIRQNPESAGSFKKIVIMGGCFDQSQVCVEPETNMRLDPLAAAEVFRALQALPSRTRPSIDVIGYDITTRCSVDFEAFERSGISPLSAAIASQWMALHPNKPLGWHDALAAVHAAGDAETDAATTTPILAFRRGNVAVDPYTGQTAFQADPAGCANVAVSVDNRRFALQYLSCAPRRSKERPG